MAPQDLAVELLGILARDLETLERIDRYARGIQDEPYMPRNSDAEYKLLAKRCISNWMPLLEGTPAQALYVDNFRPGRHLGKTSTEQDEGDNPEIEHWQRSKLDARQAAIYRGALRFGHSFVLTEDTNRGVLSKGLSALRTSAVYEDAANDLDPVAALTILRDPKDDRPGLAKMWDDTNWYTVTFRGLEDEDGIAVGAGQPHGASSCPVTRFAALVDLEGRTVGVVEPMIVLQDRINQTIFDLLLAQTYNSVKVRGISGMAPPMERNPDGSLVMGEDGQPQPKRMNHNASRFMFLEDPDAKAWTLDESPLDGFIASVDMSIRHLAAISQTPPHHLLGQIANLSAEALLAAETALSRKVAEFRVSFGESWERVFRIAAELGGIDAAALDEKGEVVWRDMEGRSLAQSADALGKLAESLEIPKRALWHRVPGTTARELADWQDKYDEDPQAAMAQALTRSTTLNAAFSDGS